MGKVHGSLARAGKVKSQTPKVEPQEKKKTPKGRAKKRITYTRRFVNVTLTGGKRKRRLQGPETAEAWRQAASPSTLQAVVRDHGEDSSDDEETINNVVAMVVIKYEKGKRFSQEHRTQRVMSFQRSSSIGDPTGYNFRLKIYDARRRSAKDLPRIDRSVMNTPSDGSVCGLRYGNKNAQMPYKKQEDESLVNWRRLIKEGTIDRLILGVETGY
ncbi:hypothetical protein LTR84_001009 [Exophiala bonariae]|uniref:40S ribosomal protein S30 n=1 Tax=Exophiala bonariae TaxID=1690606 RepID=A0AAV9NSL2_9EURO|nr:hypothetical protein LTR84_001009 [Exophiala bonariae]